MASGRLERRRRRAVIYGAVVIAFFLGLVGLSLVSQHGLPFAPRTEVRAAFSDIGSLRQGDDVRIANVRVGYVKDIELVKGNNPNGSSTVPVATLLFDNERPVYNNAQAVTASVGARSALGQKFVEFAPGDPSAGLLPANKLITAQRTVGAQELSDLLGVLDLPTRQAIGSVVRNVGGGLAGHSDDLHAGFDSAPYILPDLATVSDALNNNSGRDFASLLHSADELSRSFIGRQQYLGSLLKKLDPTLAAINADNGKAIGATLQTAPEALRKTRAALISLDTPLLNTGQAALRLQPGGRSLGQATPDTRGFLRESPRPLHKVPEVSRAGQPAFSRAATTFHKAQPLSPQLQNLFGRGGAIAQVISPFSPEASLFFTNATKALQEGNNNFHWLNFIAVVSSDDATDALGGVVRNPLQSRDAYPKPGEAPKEYQAPPGPNNVPHLSANPLKGLGR
jgi:phospholipid/cholesterol/gamma-HCH transport system substrate-binding protein